MGRTTNILKGYPDEALLEEVRRVSQLVEKPLLMQADFKKLSGIPASPLARRFGGWRATLERAGLGQMFSEGDEELPRVRPKRISDEELLEEMRRVAGLVEGRMLTKPEFKKHSKSANYHTIFLRFGSWRAALERAGLDYLAPKECFSVRRSDEELLEEVRRVAGLVEKPVLTRRDFNRRSVTSADVLARRFGSWRDILERAGLSYRFSWVIKQSDEELLEEVRRVAGLVEKPVLVQKDFNKYSKNSSINIYKRFGSWEAALERAGVGHMYSGGGAVALMSRFNQVTYTDEVLLAEVRRIAQLVEKPVFTKDDFEKHSKIASVPTLKNRFGSWRGTLERAGLSHMFYGNIESPKHTRGVRYSDEELLEEMRRVARLVEKPALTAIDFEKHSRFSASGIGRRFGSWQAALERAGVGNLYSGGRDAALSRLHQIVYSDEELLAEVRRVARLVGKRVITMADFEEHSRINLTTLARRIGAWSVVLERAGLC